MVETIEGKKRLFAVCVKLKELFEKCFIEYTLRIECHDPLQRSITITVETNEFGVGTNNYQLLQEIVSMTDGISIIALTSGKARVMFELNDVLAEG
jgi:hypothetical protein